MRITQNYLQQLELNQLLEFANSQTHKEIEVKLEYNSGMYDTETIETILMHFNEITQQVVLQNVKQQTV
ncbi:hypothetical protein SAMN05421846_105202 [Chryseobacterium taeanense]|uniref:Uncharacterized protein n=1 Tax=Chryseobacterium taeanense TaxID=311334 RepID=A0A1G8J2W7_9FLAO|nr:hypothetical protein [Chryseobacterium taeanense]SDI25392.1 hypothetical protein SAMN05421846_105202 [Chryseobacterium taeanense]